MAEQIKYPSLADLISAAMTENNVSIRGLAEQVDMTYEHVRRIVRGENVPANVVLRAICTKLGIDYKEAEKLAVAAKIVSQYGNIPYELAGKNPELVPIENAWPTLRKEQKDAVLAMVRSFSIQNKAEV